MSWPAYFAGGESAIKAAMENGYDPMSHVVAAFNERYAAAYSSSDVVDFDRLQNYRKAALEIDSALSSWFSSGPFAYHPREADWTGGKSSDSMPWGVRSDPDYWTESLMLTAIGDAELLEPTPLYEMTPWLYQRYKIVNKLRWTTGNYSRYNANNVGKWYKAGTSSGQPDGATAYAAAKSNFVSQPWIFQVNMLGIIGTSGSVSESGGIYSASVVKKKGYSYHSSWNTGGINCDLYSLARSWFATSDSDSEIQEYIYAKGQKSDVDISSDNVSGEIELGYMPQPPDNSGYSMNWTDGRMVYKWDGANGFTYKDW